MGVVSCPGSISLPGVEFLAPITRKLYQNAYAAGGGCLVVDLQRTFQPAAKRFADSAPQRQKRIDAGEKPNFLAETKWVRDAEWGVAPLPADILDRRVGSRKVERKIVVDAL